MDSINFSNFQVIHESKNEPLVFNPITPDTFKDFDTKFKFVSDTTYYDGFCEKNEEYISIYLEYGRTNPRRDEVVDIVTGESEKNLRLETQMELLKQSFFLYYYRKNTLFLSNSKHQSLYQSILKDKLQIDLIIKHIFVDIEQFIEQLRTVNRIAFTSFNDLFTEDGDMARALTDLTGTNTPTVFSIETHYDRPRMDGIKAFIRKLKLHNDNQKVGKLVISGLNDQGLSTYYNLDTFTEKIEVKSNKTNEGIFDHKEIFQQLLKEINDER
jgi:hypothetical protein